MGAGPLVQIRVETISFAHPISSHACKYGPVQAEPFAPLTLFTGMISGEFVENANLCPRPGPAES